MGFKNTRFFGGALGLLCAVFLSGVSPQASAADEEKWTNSIGVEFVLIKPGSFTMGSNTIHNAEKPPHKVTISQPFYLGKYEVTQEQWYAVMRTFPAWYTGYKKHPVENVSWDDAQEFIKKLNQKEGTDKYRLPTEAEWEYAARAGTTTA